MSQERKFSPASEKRLDVLHEDMQRLLRDVKQTGPYDFEITETLRDETTQAHNIARGKSQTKNSRHLAGGGNAPCARSDHRAYAADLNIRIAGKVTWQPIYYQKLAAHVKIRAEILGVPIVWGGDWRTLRDLCHFELDRRTYP